MLITTYRSEKVVPYVYKCTHQQTKQYYIGVRWANIVPSTDDLGTCYFTSSECVRSDFLNFSYEILAEFFNKEDAFAFEQDLIQQSWGDPLLLNSMFTLRGKPGFSGMTGKKHTEETKHIMSLRAKGLDDEVEKIKDEKLTAHYKRRSEAMISDNPGFKSGNIPWNTGKRMWTDSEKLEQMIKKREATKASNPLVHTLETREKLRACALNRPRISCIFCRRELPINNFSRHVCPIKPL